MKKLSILVAAIGAVAAMASCGGPSNQQICEDLCNQEAKCLNAALGGATGASSSSGSSGTTGSVTTNCSTSCSSSASSSSSSNACKNSSAWDSCINGVDASNASTCQTDLTMCETTNC